MPKIKERISVTDKANKRLSELISGRMAYFGYEWQDIAIKLDVSLSTIYRKAKKPETWTLGELRDLTKILDIKSNEIGEVIKLGG